MPSVTHSTEDHLQVETVIENIDGSNMSFILNDMHLFIYLFIFVVLFSHNKEREYCRWNENDSFKT